MVDIFAPEKRVEIIEEQFRETWNTDEIINAIVKRNKLFKNWIHSPIGTICEKYKTARNNFSNLIKKEELKEFFQKLGENLTPKKIFKTFKPKKYQGQNTNILPDVEISNKSFLSVWPLLFKTSRNVFNFPY